jgi:hypothetical protein
MHIIFTEEIFIFIKTAVIYLGLRASEADFSLPQWPCLSPSVSSQIIEKKKNYPRLVNN